MKRLVWLLIFMCFLGLFVGSIGVREAEAAPIEQTDIIYSDTDDGLIAAIDADYMSAHDTIASYYVVDTTISLRVGQQNSVILEVYQISRSFLFFDTSTIPNGVTVKNATLSLYLETDESTDAEFNITLRHNLGNYPHQPLAAGDYYYGYYPESGGSLNSSALTAGYNNITLNSQGLGWIDITSITNIVLFSSRDLNATAPTGDEFVDFFSREKGVSYAPKLYVTYSTEGYHYIVHGPYWENGSNATITVNVTLSIENTDPYSFQLDGTGGNADSEDIQIEQKGVAFTWNFSSYVNYSRTYYLTNDTFDEIWIYIPNVASETVNLYTLMVTDFVGVTNAYLETVHTVGGQNRIVERQSLAVINELPFWMVWAHRYDIRLVCDQGTHNFGAFIAGAEFTQSLIIFAGMFPPTYPGLDLTVKAKRMNATWIQANYTDNQELTSWVQVTIKYKSGYSWATAYTTNNTGNTQQVNWHEADEDEDYVTYVAAYRDEQLKTWSFGCPKPAGGDNPWEDTLEGLGISWPFPPKYLIGLFIVLAVFGVFSYANMPLGVILGLIAAAILNLFGWLDVSWNLLALGFSIGIFAWIARAKREEREI